MNIKALITTLVLGTSSVALAEPTFTASAQASWSWGTPSASAQTVRDHRRPWVYDQTQLNTAYDPNFRTYRVNPWMQQPIFQDSCMDPRNTTVGATGSTYTGAIMTVPANRSYYWYRPSWHAVTEPTRIDSGREFINLGGAGQLDRLMFKQVGGSSFIQQVAIYFANGEIQVVRNLDAQLDRNRQTVGIDLNGGRRAVSRVIVYGSNAPHSAYQLMAM